MCPRPPSTGSWTLRRQTRPQSEAAQHLELGPWPVCGGQWGTCGQVCGSMPGLAQVGPRGHRRGRWAVVMAGSPRYPRSTARRPGPHTLARSEPPRAQAGERRTTSGCSRQVRNAAAPRPHRGGAGGQTSSGLVVPVYKHPPQPEVQACPLGAQPPLGKAEQPESFMPAPAGCQNRSPAGGAPPQSRSLGFPQPYKGPASAPSRGSRVSTPRRQNDPHTGCV